jgi:excisionase family DNA binding protein
MAALLTAKAVGDRLQVDKSTVYRMASDGRLPAVKVGRQWRFPADAVERILHLGPLGTPPAATTAGIDPARAGAIVDLAAEALGVMMVVTDAEGRPLTPVANPCARFLDLARDPDTVAECAEEWRELAADPVNGPRFRPGRHGFLCARSLVRHNGVTLGMVLAGGVAADGEAADDLYVLDADHRRRVVSTLPRVAGLLADVAIHDRPNDGATGPSQQGSQA